MQELKIFQTFLLFFAAAIAEIVGCYLPYLILKQGKTAWLWLPTIISLSLFVWLLTLHPTATGRVYAAYGGIYIMMALAWLRWVDGVNLSWWDIAGGVVVLIGASMIILQPSAFR
ncbi:MULTISPECIES: YnfA family protein [unclassified Acinetobacter]|uniref:YnfA family protein n=1 Tax=unclassified Acinetobacter TaxID=196816 RepID=UPI0035B95E54